MRWRADFYAHYYGKKKVVDWDKPDHTMAVCPEPETFFERLYRGVGGYRKTVDKSNDEGGRWVVFESDSGEWHLFGAEENNCGA